MDNKKIISLVDLVKRENLYYEKFNDNPFTGKCKVDKYHQKYFVDGSVEKEIFFHKNGNLLQEINKKNDTSKRYYDNGQLQIKIDATEYFVFRNTEYYKNGKLKLESKYRPRDKLDHIDNNVIGWIKNFYENGKKKEIELFIKREKQKYEYGVQTEEEIKTIKTQYNKAGKVIGIIERIQRDLNSALSLIHGRFFDFQENGIPKHKMYFWKGQRYTMYLYHKDGRIDLKERFSGNITDIDSLGDKSKTKIIRNGKGIIHIHEYEYFDNNKLKKINKRKEERNLDRNFKDMIKS